MIYEATLSVTNGPGGTFKLEGGPWGRSVVAPLHDEVFESLVSQWRGIRSDAHTRLLTNLELEQIGAVWGPSGWPRGLGDELTRMREYCATTGTQLRVRLSSGLEDLPVECWRLPGDREPLAFDPLIRFCRWVDAGELAPPHFVRKPRVLLAFANPGTPRFARLPWLEDEIQAIAAALRQVAEIQIIADVVPAHLEQRLRDFRPDIFHFSGHGESRVSGDILIAQGQSMGTSAAIRVEDLGKWLRNAGTPMAILSACDSHAFAAKLVERAGLVAAIGMQLPFRVGAAPAFSRALYGALADGRTLDDALAQARQMLRDRESDWLAPLLYTRAKSAPVVAVNPLAFAATPPTPHNLGGWDRPFVGRNSEREMMRRLLLSSESRLVVITGLGGMGKSRLSRQVGEDLLNEFPDGVWMVSGANAQNVSALWASVRATAVPDVSPVISLTEALGDRRMLLIFDACESLHGSEFRDAVRDLMERTSRISVLISSRVHLGLEHEVDIPLGPLTLPLEDAVEASDSFALLMQTVRESYPNFQLSREDRTMVARICQDVEGIPLAIILAASRLRYVGLTELAEMLRESRLQTLASSVGGAHGSIGRVLEGSLTQLSPDDLHFLWCLSVFRGGFTLADMVAVHHFDRFSAMDAIGRLNDQCLIETERIDHRTRYHILETISDFVRTKVQLGDWRTEWEQIRYAHAAHYVSLAERAVQSMEHGEWGSGARSLWNELGNLRAAMLFAVEEGHHRFVRTLADALARGLFEHGLWSDLDILLDAADRAAEKLGDPHLLARMLGIRGALVARRGDLEGSRQIWERRAEICGQIGDLAGRADALIDVMTREVWIAPVSDLRQRLEEAAELAGRADKPELVATAYAMQALLAERDEEPSSAIRWAECAERVPRPKGAEDPLLFVDINVGRAYLYGGRLAQAERAYRSALGVAAHGERRHHVAASLHGLAVVYAKSGRPVVSVRSAHAATSLYAALGSRWKETAAQRLHDLSRQFPAAASLLSPQIAWRDVVNEILHSPPLDSPSDVSFSS